MNGKLPMKNPSGWLVKTCLLMGLGLLLSTGLFAQRQITGTVSNTSGEALVGATVVVKGSTQGTLTDNAGGFRISAGEGSTLLFSFIGYESQEVAVGSSNVINVTLKVDDVTLTEVVVTGYTTQRKEDLTGSVSVVKPKELMEVPTGNVANQLQGRVAGMTVSQDGRPGSPTKVRIRGIGSFGNNDPLYVVDGVPTQDINTLNPNDIESISVLKDAGAASIYGSRASNGVVVITTKRGSEGVNVGYSMFTGVQDPGPGPQNLLSAQGYADLQWLVYANDGTDEIHPVYGPSPAAGGSNPTLPSWAANTNWWDELTDPALITNHDITLSGGTKNAKFYAGVNYFRQDGVVIETYTQRLSARFNSEFNIKDRVTIGENFVLTHNLNGRGVGNNAESAPIMDVYRNQSIIPSRITTPIEGIARTFVPGEYGGGGLAPRLGNGSNPVASAERDADDYGFNIRLVGSAFADVKILEGLNFRTTFGGTYGMNYFVNYNFATYERAENVATPSFTEGAGFGGDWVWTNTITFDRDFGANSILAVAGYEAVKYGIGRGVSGQRAGYFSDAVSFRTLNNGANIVAANSGFGTPTTLVSNFLRVDYGYDSKYLLSATVRRDGSSRFGSNNRFGIFPSVTAAWRVGQEDFLIGNGFISDLKIRGGYGTMGNQLSVAPDNQFFLFGGSPNTSNYDLNGTGTSSLQGFRPTRIGNADAKWETNVTTNIGFDAAFLDNKLEFVFDYYIKSNVDLLFNQELPGIAGAASAPSVNIAEMRNDGIDMQLIYRQQSGDFGFEGNLTFTTYRNEIVSLADSVEFFDFGGSRIGSFNRNQVGMPISSFFGFQVDGIFQNQGEVDGAATQEGAEPGFLRFADIDGDGEITPEDRTFIGNPNPDFTAGLNLNFTYKNWDMSTFLYASYGAEIFNFTRWWVDYWPSFQGQKSTDLLNNSWTLDRPDATVPKASNKSNFSTNTQSTSYYIEDGSYLRMRNLQIGYTFQPQPGSALGSMRVYLQGSNLFTLTPYSGVDPELNTRDDREIGVDEGTYPVVRQFLIGLSLGF